MMLKNILICTGLVIGSTACMEQYNPRPHWNKLKQERAIAHFTNPKLTEDGKLPAGYKGEAVVKVFNASEVYNANCVACHGSDGSAAVNNARDFSDASWQSIATDEEIAAVITLGSVKAAASVSSLANRSQHKVINPLMTPWAHLFAKDSEKRQEQLAKLIELIRSFKK